MGDTTRVCLHLKKYEAPEPRLSSCSSSVPLTLKEKKKTSESTVVVIVSWRSVSFPSPRLPPSRRRRPSPPVSGTPSPVPPPSGRPQGPQGSSLRPTDGTGPDRRKRPNLPFPTVAVSSRPTSAPPPGVDLGPSPPPFFTSDPSPLSPPLLSFSLWFSLSFSGCVSSTRPQSVYFLCLSECVFHRFCLCVSLPVSVSLYFPLSLSVSSGCLYV